MRSALGDRDVEALDFPNCAYKATVPVEPMNYDPAVSHPMTDVNRNLWVNHQRYIMAYPIRNGSLYNLVLPYLGKASVGKWDKPGDPEEMKNHYKNWDPTIRRVLGHITSCSKWKLAYLPLLKRWTSDNGRALLIGDVAHAMFPYMAQGAAASIKDGSAMAEML